MKKNLFFIALALIVLLGVVSPVSAGNGENTCPESAKPGHFCAQSPGKIITDPETGEIITGVMAREWSMPSCLSLPNYKKASENKDGWNLLFTENCNVKATPAPTEQPTQPATEPTQKPNVETNESTTGLVTDTETVGGCRPECMCIEYGPETRSFIMQIVDKFLERLDKIIEIWAKK